MQKYKVVVKQMKKQGFKRRIVENYLIDLGLFSAHAKKLLKSFR